MKKLSHFKLFLIAPTLVLTACGYGLKEVYEGIPYNSSNFFENYFNEWNSQINPYDSNNRITDKKDVYSLNSDTDKVFTSLDDVNFRDCDPNWNSYAYTYDKENPDDGTLAYGPAVCLAKANNSFKYGITSKMFDGQMFCNGDYQKSRTQVEPTNHGESKGFGVLFSKECNNPSYFMMNFKCSVVLADNQNLRPGSSNLKITVSFVLKNDTGYTYVPVTYTVNEVPTNSGDDHFVPPYSGRKEMYTCFGFKLDNLNLDRLIGFTIQYEKISDTVSPTYEGQETYHAMMLYEVSFPHSTWH